MAKNQELPVGKRAALYVDGFNFYHPIHENNQPFLKWERGGNDCAGFCAGN